MQIQSSLPRRCSPLPYPWTAASPESCLCAARLQRTRFDSPENCLLETWLGQSCRGSGPAPLPLGSRSRGAGGPQLNMSGRPIYYSWLRMVSIPHNSSSHPFTQTLSSRLRHRPHPLLECPAGHLSRRSLGRRMRMPRRHEHSLLFAVTLPAGAHLELQVHSLHPTEDPQGESRTLAGWGQGPECQCGKCLGLQCRGPCF